MELGASVAYFMSSVLVHGSIRTNIVQIQKLILVERILTWEWPKWQVSLILGAYVKITLLESLTDIGRENIPPGAVGAR